MEQRLTPGFFYGSAIAALIGLLFGLTLHIAWRKHPGGPQILLGSTAAAATVHAAPGGASADSPPPLELADEDTGHVRPDPQPVTRLAPEMFDLQPAAADEAERQDAAGLVAGDVPQPLPRDFD